MPQPPLLVVMGVSGSGKSAVGFPLAEHLGVPFLDADDLHPRSNLATMAAGIPLGDDDRWPWLALVGDALAAASRTGLVVACSALKRAYRDAIRGAAPTAVFVHLTGSRELLASRLANRVGHFMPLSLLDSQLADLEPLAHDERGVTVDVDREPHEIVTIVVAAAGESV